jgi:hypothetical protein
MCGDWPCMAACYRYVIVMNYIALTLARRCQRAVFFGRPYGGRLGSHRDSFMADQRGAVAFEMLIVWLFMMLSLLLPLADLAIAGFKFISAYQALRDMGQRTQYSTPDATDPNSITDWKSSLPTTVDGFTINAKVYCGDAGTEAPCAAATWPKYYTFQTSFTLSPMVLGSVLCSTCTVNYSERFQ